MVTNEHPPLDPPELLAPAGDWDCLRAAVANGADAVYFGLPRFNARMRAENFSEDNLPEVVEFLHNHGVKANVALNVLIFTEELDDAVEELRVLNAVGVDAVIIQDVGLAEIARRMFPALRVHASTQMTITSPEGVRFARTLGARQVVLARELSMRELEKFDRDLPLEVFVHGALCVAYSGQCLTSESLGQRSANRGECAQACRMPYGMVVDGVLRDLGDKRYLLSPQDLAAVREIPALMERGVRSFKIEGRLKTPEYVAAVTRVYRQAIDAVLGVGSEGGKEGPTADDWYRMEMTFSRGLSTGWMHGVDHQKLVGATYGKKRGPFAGCVTEVGRDYVTIAGDLPLKAGDGIVFENAADTDAEQGGRIFECRGEKIFFPQGAVNFQKLRPGTRVWKTGDPALVRELRKTWQVRFSKDDGRKIPLRLSFSGRVGQPLVVSDGEVSAASAANLEPAEKIALDGDLLVGIFSRLNETPYRLVGVECAACQDVFLARSELTRLKHALVEALVAQRVEKNKPSGVTLQAVREDLAAQTPDEPRSRLTRLLHPRLAVLCRSFEQIEAALQCGVTILHIDLEDIRRYRDAVAMVENRAEVFLATPRIQKAGEEGFFKLIEKAAPDGVLIRNLGAIEYFEKSPLRKIGDFSLNVSNPVTAAVFLRHGLERVTVSYDLTIDQVLSLLAAGPAGRFELTIHQHMPMFHMEHCAFAAFLSQGSSFLDCGRPCDTHRVHLRDRVGIDHPLRADVGCRNTLFNATAQTGAIHFEDLHAAGLGCFRVELLEESEAEAGKILHTYLALLEGKKNGAELWRDLNAQSKLGVTGGTLVPKRG